MIKSSGVLYVKIFERSIVMEVSFDPKELIADEFCLSYADGEDAEKAFLQAVKQFDGAAEWKDVPVTDIRILATSKLEEFHGGPDAANEESYLSAKIGRRGGLPYVLRPWTCKSLRSLCQDDPGIFKKILAEGRANLVARRLNEDLGFLPKNKELLVLVRGEKISGLFGDFNSEWTQSEQLAALKRKLMQMFAGHEFLSGSIGHIETKASYKLGPSIMDSKFLKSTHGTAAAAVLTPYIQAWTDAGMDPQILKEAVPILEFRTGESGLAQLMLVPRILYKTGRVTTSCLLGEPMKVKHRGATVWDTYVEYLTSVAATYQNGIRGIVDLSQRKIEHPYSCLTHLLKQLRPSTPAEEFWSTLESFEMQYPQTEEKSCQAFLLYEVINDMNQRASAKVSVTKQLQNMEFTAKMLSPKFNWKRFDVAAPVSFGKGGVLREDDE